MQCPKCQFEQHFESDECARCGIVFARYRAAAATTGLGGRATGIAAAAAATAAGSTPAEMSAPAVETPLAQVAAGSAAAPDIGFRNIQLDDEPPPVHGIDALGWKAFAIGLGLAVLTQFIGFLEMLIGYMVVLVHEMGHALAGWSFGYPSIPAFDFTYGGGVTTHQETQSLLLVGLVLASFVALGWMLRRNTASLALVTTFAAIYAALAFSNAHHVVIVAMGHGAELCFAGIFIQRALTGRACHMDVERPLYAWIGFHIVLHDIAFAYGLATSAMARQQYADAKGGGHWMDFSRMAFEHLGVSLESVAIAFLVLCVATPFVAFAFAWLGPERAWLREQVGRV